MASTIIGEGIITLIFYGVAFGGMLETSSLIKGMIVAWAAKTLWEIIALPLTYKILTLTVSYLGSFRPRIIVGRWRMHRPDNGLRTHPAFLKACALKFVSREATADDYYWVTLWLGFALRLAVESVPRFLTIALFLRCWLANQLKMAVSTSFLTKGVSIWMCPRFFSSTTV